MHQLSEPAAAEKFSRERVAAAEQCVRDDLPAIPARDISALFDETRSVARGEGRYVWSRARHQLFVHAVEELGLHVATPTSILCHMAAAIHSGNLSDDERLTAGELPTRHNVKSHLQKYRLKANARLASTGLASTAGPYTAGPYTAPPPGRTPPLALSMTIRPPSPEVLDVNGHAPSPTSDRPSSHPTPPPSRGGAVTPPAVLHSPTTTAHSEEVCAPNIVTPIFVEGGGAPSQHTFANLVAAVGWVAEEKASVAMAESAERSAKRLRMLEGSVA